MALDNTISTSEYVSCKECIFWEDCENKENRDGRYFGEKESGENETAIYMPSVRRRSFYHFFLEVVCYTPLRGAQIYEM